MKDERNKQKADSRKGSRSIKYMAMTFHTHYRAHVQDRVPFDNGQWKLRVKTGKTTRQPGP